MVDDGQLPASSVGAFLLTSWFGPSMRPMTSDAPSPTRNDYERLIDRKRKRASKVAEGRTIVEETESDRGRLVFSAPFRRLAQKTQVFALEADASVRSRLTHSLEVGFLGRLIAQKACRELSSKSLLGVDIQSAFANLVETACLMHDIGNPPFGHFGESAIQKWFSEHGEDCFKASVSPIGSEPNVYREEFLPDFESFDGNAQGFRIITKLQWQRDEFGLNLTLSQLATFLKYLRATNEKSDGHLFRKKPGYFRCEASLVREVWAYFGLDIAKQRFPLTYIVEAADDIAYCLSDIEDSLDKGLTSEEAIKSGLEEAWSSTASELAATPAFLIERLERAWRQAKAGLTSEKATFFDFKTRLTGELVDEAARAYVAHHNEIMSGTAKPLLHYSADHHATLEALKAFARKKIFRAREVEDIELAGYQIIHGLLGHLRPLLELRGDDFDAVVQQKQKSASGAQIKMHQRLYNLVPNKHRMAYEHAVQALPSDPKKRLEEWFLRAHLIVDYLSGMTDGFALDTYQLLSGIRVTS
ncbi:MAG: dGTPase [Pseudomonadota bacterium]